MHRNPAWLTFLVLVTCTVGWFGFQAMWKVINYRQLDTHTTAEYIDWQVKALSEEVYALEGKYRYRVNELPYEGVTVFSDNLFRNAWAAEQVIPIYAKEETEVWYSHKNPQHSSLQKKFPLKECISAAFLAGLLGYFLWLGFYVGRYRT